MKEYHKIQTVFKRDPATNHKTLLMWDWSLPEFGYLADNRWEFTEKVDGTNIRVMWDGTTVTFGGKTDAAQVPAELLNRLNAVFTAGKMREVFTGPVCLYGEGCGPKIQKCGAMYGDKQDIILFDVSGGGLWLSRRAVESIAEQFGVRSAPVIGHGAICDMVKWAQAGISSVVGTGFAEGIVARPEVELLTRRGERIITKIKTKDFGGGR